MNQEMNKTFHLSNVCTTIYPMLRQLIGRFRNWRYSREQRRIIESARIDPSEKCPACGWRVGTIQFRPTLRVVVHTCAICRATWGEKTIVEVDAWSTTPVKSRVIGDLAA